MKRVASCLIALILFTGICATECYAGVPAGTSYTSKKVMVYLKPDITIKWDNQELMFYNSNKKVAYPIIYNGTTYLPLRAAAALMEEPIEWDEPSKTVFIGRTLTNPNKNDIMVTTGSAIGIKGQVADDGILKPCIVNAYLKTDTIVMYDFEIQTFTDANGSAVYPIIYNSTTYLPIRAISNLMMEPIAWDGGTKTISIGDGKEEPATEPEDTTSPAIGELENLFNSGEILYYEATAKVSKIKNASSQDELVAISSAISDNYMKAQALTAEVKAVDKADYTSDELAAYDKLAAFNESMEYYILVLENISCLAVQGEDYSMLADTFLYFAMESKTKMDEARDAIYAL